MSKKILVTVLFLFFLSSTMITASGGEEQVKEKKVNTTIQFIRNATMKIHYGGVTFLTDPMLGNKGTLPGYLPGDKLVNPTAELPVSKEKILEGTDALLLSHTHITDTYTFKDLFSDHMDPDALRSLDRKLPVYLQPYDVKGMEHMGFKNLYPVDKKITVGAVTIHRFEGKHVDIDAMLPEIGESSGYVFSAPGAPVILWTGDTLLTEGVKGAIRKFKPDVIIVHSGGAAMPVDKKGNKMHLVLGAEETVEIAGIAPEAKIIAIHMEALDHCPVTRKALRIMADKNGIKKDRLIIPADGETIKL